jgi:hypothetical protein
MTSPVHNEAFKELCAQLTSTETVYPKTDLRLVYEFLGPP